jgi:hypothetical protein
VSAPYGVYWSNLWIHESDMGLHVNEKCRASSMNGTSTVKHICSEE